MLRSVQMLPAQTDRMAVERVALAILRAWPEDRTKFTPAQLVEILIENKTFEQIDEEREVRDGRQQATPGTWTRKMYTSKTTRVLHILEQSKLVSAVNPDDRSLFVAHSAQIAFEWEQNCRQDVDRAVEALRQVSNRYGRYGKGALRAALTGMSEGTEAAPDAPKISPLKPNTRLTRGLGKFLESPPPEK